MQAINPVIRGNSTNINITENAFKLEINTDTSCIIIANTKSCQEGTLKNREIKLRN